MRILFIGVGEACDENYPNTSILLMAPNDNGHDKTLLLDCGFSAVHAFWKYVSDPELLDLVWISHFHGDHFMGLPLLFLRMWEMGRNKPLVIVGQQGLKDVVERAMELAYPGFMNRFRFELTFYEVEPGEEKSICGFRWNFAETEHSRCNLSVAIETPHGKVFYSGDGKPTNESATLASGATLMIHEAFHVMPKVPGHGTVSGVISIAKDFEIENIALVHVQRDVRRWKQLQIRKMLDKSGINAWLPQPGDTLEFD